MAVPSDALGLGTKNKKNLPLFTFRVRLLKPKESNNSHLKSMELFWIKTCDKIMFMFITNKLVQSAWNRKCLTSNWYLIFCTNFLSSSNRCRPSFQKLGKVNLMTLECHFRQDLCTANVLIRPKLSTPLIKWSLALFLWAKWVRIGPAWPHWQSY